LLDQPAIKIPYVLKVEIAKNNRTLRSRLTLKFEVIEKINNQLKIIEKKKTIGEIEKSKRSERTGRINSLNINFRPSARG
jgi:hypothetical protein